MKIQDFFSKIFYINLDHRIDRKDEFLNEMKSIGLDSFVERIPGVLPHPKEEITIGRARHIACGTVHRNLIQYAKDNNLDNILIFEDDAVLYEDGLSNIEKALDDIHKIKDWDMLYLSGLVFDDNLKYVTDNLVKANIVLTGHAYAVNKCAYDRILKYNPKTDCAIDGWYGQQTKEGGELGSLLNKYLVYPLSIYQRNSVSDIDISDDGVPSMGHGLLPYIITYSKPIIK